MPVTDRFSSRRCHTLTAAKPGFGHSRSRLHFCCALFGGVPFSPQSPNEPFESHVLICQPSWDAQCDGCPSPGPALDDKLSVNVSSTFVHTFDPVVPRLPFSHEHHIATAAVVLDGDDKITSIVKRDGESGSA
jgi:hypothetical protein